MTFSLALLLTSAAQAGTCGSITLNSADSVTIAETAVGPHLSLGDLSITGVEHDEIDLASACVPTIGLGPLALRGVEPDEIDNALMDQGGLDILFLEESEPAPAVREHVLLGRGGITLESSGHVLIGRVPARGGWTTVTTTGTLVLAPSSGSLSQEKDAAGVVSSSFSLSLELVEVVPDRSIRGLVIDTVQLQSDTGFATTDGLALELYGPTVR